MNPKIFVGVAVTIIIVIIGAIAFSGQNIISDTSGKGIFSSPQNPPSVILSLDIELDKLEIVEIDEKFAVIDVKFKVSNPNQRSVILQFLKYSLFEGDLRVHAGQIGDRFEGFVEGSNFYTVLSSSHTVLSDTIILQNTGNTPELWATLSSGDPDWRVAGEAFYNLSSMTAGGENSVEFEFTK